MSFSVASYERSFSKLKLVKIYLRSQMSVARLPGVVEKFNFHDVIKDFATRKARKFIGK